MKNFYYSILAVLILLSACKSKDEEEVDPVFTVTSSSTTVLDVNCCEFFEGDTVLGSRFEHRADFQGPTGVALDSVAFEYDFGSGSVRRSVLNFDLEITSQGTGSIGSNLTSGYITTRWLWKFFDRDSFEMTIFLYSNKGTSSAAHTINKPSGANKIGNIGRGNLLSHPTSIIDHRND